jgi:hypothetical protein
MEGSPKNNSRSSTDLYSYISENSPEKIICLSISIVGIIFGLPKKNTSNHKTTLIHIVFNFCLWTCFEYILFVEILDVCRYIFGPLASYICYLKIILRSSLACIMYLYINATLVMKYVYIFWLKNPAAFNDNFWSYFIVIWAHMAALVCPGVYHFLTTSQPLEFYACTGQDPTKILDNPYRSIVIAKIVSVILNILLYSRIQVHKRKMTTNNTLQTQQQVCFSIDDILKKIQKQSLTTFVNCVIVIIFLLVSGVTELKLNFLKFEEIGHFPNNLIYHYRNLVAPLLAITLIISICFQNKNYKQSIKEKIKMLYCEICNQSIT